MFIWTVKTKEMGKKMGKSGDVMVEQSDMLLPYRTVARKTARPGQLKRRRRIECC